MKKLIEKVKRAIGKTGRRRSSGSLSQKELRAGAKRFVRQYGDVIKKLSSE